MSSSRVAQTTCCRGPAGTRGASTRSECTEPVPDPSCCFATPTTSCRCHPDNDEPLHARRVSLIHFPGSKNGKHSAAMPWRCVFREPALIRAGALVPGCVIHPQAAGYTRGRNLLTGSQRAFLKAQRNYDTGSTSMAEILARPQSYHAPWQATRTDFRPAGKAYRHRGPTAPGLAAGESRGSLQCRGDSRASAVSLSKNMVGTRHRRPHNYITTRGTLCF